MVGILIVAVVCTFLVGRYVLAMDPGTIVRILAGDITNTPALAAAGEASGQESLATVRYAVSYLFGALGMIIAAQLALCKALGDIDTPDSVTYYNVRVERDNRSTIEQVEAELGDSVEISHMRRGEEGSIWIPGNDEVLEKDDPVTVIGTIENVGDALKHLGYKSSHSLRSDRQVLDFWYITVFKHSHAGKTVAKLDKELKERWDARTSRIRRGDAGMLAIPNFMVESGDHVRVVDPTFKLKEVSRWLGDSSKGPSDINSVTLGLGLALGYFTGEIEFSIPGGGHSALGYAADILIVGSIMGKMGRIGSFITALPSILNAVLAGLGLLVFFTRAGTNAGTQILEAFSGGYQWEISTLGFITTTVMAVLLYIVMRGMFKMGGTKFSDLLGGAQTQPAVPVFANGRTGADPRVALGYALVHSVAMIVKILLTHVLGIL